MSLYHLRTSVCFSLPLMFLEGAVWMPRGMVKGEVKCIQRSDFSL